ncbi:PAS domain S-box protein [Aquiflexum gelatinilyticum]|uniref:histidine kinase n=1 Tax=Aquiflexum gelatinilyticum TaxID=2961943 RepID=A0A9X2P7T2_9BACT|nr:PAS domain S-box protein [Aquiflexum gelatinilyticum]MCR9016411.1 PAS domain S-box protein [Aquiflexum gelatinilyticum]
MNRSANILGAIGESYYLLQSNTNLKEAIPYILYFLGSSSEVDRIYIFKNHFGENGEALFSYKFEWCAEGVEPQIDAEFLQNAPWSMYPETVNKLSKNQVINELVKDTADPDFYEAMTEQGILSYLFVPIFSGDYFWGFIGFDNCKSEELFSTEQASALHAFASTLGNTFLVRKQQKKILKSQKHYRFLVNNINDVVFKYDLKGNLHFLNSTWERTTGFNIEESIGKSFFDFVEAPCSEALEKKMDHIVSKKITKFEKELQLKTSKKGPIWVKMEGILMLDRKGSAAGVFGTLIDIDKEKKGLEALIESDKRNQAIINTVKDALYTFDAFTGKCIFLSDNIVLLGFEKSQYINDKDFRKKAIHPHDRAMLEKADSKLLKTGSLDLIYRIINNQGELKWVQEKSWMEKDAHGNNLRIHGRFTDVTELKTKELKLQKSEERFRTITENIPFPLIICSVENGNIFYLNKDFRDILGFTRSDSIIDLNLDEIFVLQHQKVPLSEYFLHYGDVKNLEVKLEFKGNKTELWYSLSSQRIPFMGEEAMVVVLFDINDRKKAEESAFSLNELLKAVNETQISFFLQEDFISPLETLLDKMLHLTDSKFGFIGEVLYDRHNQPYLKSHTLTNIAWSEETQQFYKQNYSTGLEFRNLNTLFGESLRTGQIVIANKAYADPRAGGTPNGHPRLDRYLGIPVYKGEEFVGLMGLANKSQDYLMSDVEFLEPLVSSYANLIQAIRINRKKKESDKMRKQADEMYRLLSENTGDIIALHDPEMVFQYVSPSIEKVLGYTPPELIGKTPAEAFNVIDVKNQIDSQTKVVLPHKHKTNGSLVFLEVLLKPLKDEDGKTFSILATSRDVTERELGVKELKKAILRERELNQLKSRFISMTSHEFRTPLSTILSSTDLLLMMSQKDNGIISKVQLDEHLNRIINQIKRLNNVINDVLILEKNEHEKITYVLQPMYIIGFISSLIADFNDQKDPSKAIKLYFPEKEKLIYSDPVWLTHVFRNIIENALKYSLPESKAPELTLEYLAKSFEITVKDYGMGIPKEDQKYIFNSFFRSRNVSNIKGTGLGLNIVNEFVKKLGGKIKFKSELGKGSEFIVKLPYKS